MTVVTHTDRPKSVRNLCVIEDFDGVFVLSHCVFGFFCVVGFFFIGVTLRLGFFCGCRGIFYRTESDLFLFL